MSPLVIKLFVFAIMLGSAFLAGVKVESDHRDAQLLTQERAANDVYRQAVARDRTIAGEVSLRIEADTSARESAARAVVQRIRTAPPDALATCPPPIPPAGRTTVADATPTLRLTGAFVGLFNDALGAGLPAAYGAWRTDESPTGTDPASVLANVADNAVICNGLRSQVLGFQSWVTAQGWVK